MSTFRWRWALDDYAADGWLHLVACVLAQRGIDAVQLRLREGDGLTRAPIDTLPPVESDLIP